MKNFFNLILLTAALFSAASCFHTKPSSIQYTLNATFEYSNTLDGSVDESVAKLFGADSLLASQYVRMDDFSALCSKVSGEGTDAVMVGGWTLSMKKGSLDENGQPTPFCAAGNARGYQNSNTYAVFYENPDPSRMAEQDVLFDFSRVSNPTCIPVGCMVNNTSAVVTAVKNPETGFGSGDYVKLTVTGYWKGVQVGTAEKYLVDYRGAEPVLLTKWDAFDLSKIAGNVDKLKFHLESSKPGIPPYFCMDNFSVKIGCEY